MSWMWVVWLLVIIVSFALIEGYALRHPERQNTLSRFIWGLGQEWPLTLVLFGMLFGGLAVHFFWNWCPAVG